MGDVSSGAYALKQRGTARGLHVSAGHARQLLAALIGRKTLAAFQGTGEPATITDVTALLVDLDLTEDSAGELGLPAEIVTVAAETLTVELPVSIHRRWDNLVALQDESSRRDREGHRRQLADGHDELLRVDRRRLSRGLRRRRGHRTTADRPSIYATGRRAHLLGYPDRHRGKSAYTSLRQASVRITRCARYPRKTSLDE